jgi:hypothetical protein
MTGCNRLNVHHDRKKIVLKRFKFYLDNRNKSSEEKPVISQSQWIAIVQ